MPLKRPNLIIDEIYHVVLRAVGDTIIFNDENDYYRGIFALYEFNNAKPVDIWHRRIERKKEKILEALEGRTFQAPKRELLVDVLAFCFMPNHIHMILKQIRENGITRFMQKVGTGYAVYFNKKYNRRGHLFGRFRAKHIKDDIQLSNAFAYTHVNPVSLIEPNFKENGIANPEKSIVFLKNYKWHSYPDYIGHKNFPSVIKKEFFLNEFGGESGCRKNVEAWINYKGNAKICENADFE